MLNSVVVLSNTDKNSSITYSITVYNSTNKDCYFDKVDYLIDDTTYSNTNIVFDLDGISKDDVLASKKSKTFNITFYYKNNVLSDNNELVSYLNFKFVFDTVNPTWNISSVSSNNVKTTDTFSFRISGSDDREGIISNLTSSNISYYINGINANPIDSSLVLISKTENEIIYELTIVMLGGNGNITVNIDKDTLIDNSGNKNIKTELNTDICVVKNDDFSILILKDYDSRFYDSISNYYSKIDRNDSITVDQIIAKKYNLAVFYYPFWQPKTYLNNIFDAGINLIVQANDSLAGLYINKDDNFVFGDISSINVNKVNANNITKYLPDTLIESDSNLNFQHFNSDAKVLYQTTYNGVTYDKVGYLKRNDTVWFHIAIPNNFGSKGYVPIIEFIEGNLAE